MPLLLLFTGLKCHIRTTSSIKRFYWTSHGFTFREGLGIRYFMPRTMDISGESKRDLMKERYSIPREFKLIYDFSNYNWLKSATSGSVLLGLVIIYLLFDYERVVNLGERLKTEEDGPISEDLTSQYDYTFSGTITKIKRLGNSAYQNIYSGEPRAKLAVALMMIIIFFLVRSRCVLNIYRHEDDFVTVFPQVFGFGRKLIGHRADDCCFYPRRKLFTYNVMGKNAIIFSEFFISEEERKLYAGWKK